MYERHSCAFLVKIPWDEILLCTVAWLVTLLITKILHYVRGRLTMLAQIKGLDHCWSFLMKMSNRYLFLKWLSIWWIWYLRIFSFVCMWCLFGWTGLALRNLIIYLQVLGSIVFNPLLFDIRLDLNMAKFHCLKSLGVIRQASSFKLSYERELRFWFRLLIEIISCIRCQIVLATLHDSFPILIRVVLALTSPICARLSQQTWLALFSALGKPCKWWRTRIRGVTYLTWMVQALEDLVPLSQLRKLSHFPFYLSKIKLILCYSYIYILWLVAMGQLSVGFGSFKHLSWKSASGPKLGCTRHPQGWSLQICSWGTQTLGFLPNVKLEGLNYLLHAHLMFY